MPSTKEILSGALTVIDIVSYPFRLVFGDIAESITNTISALVTAAINLTGDNTDPLANATVNIAEEGMQELWKLFQTEGLPFADSAIEQLKDSDELPLVISGPLTGLQAGYHTLKFLGIIRSKEDTCKKKNKKKRHGLFSIL